MEDAERLLPGEPHVRAGTWGGVPARAGRRARAAGALAALLLLPSLYLLNRPPCLTLPRPRQAVTYPYTEVNFTPVNETIPQGFLVYSPSCKIPDIDPRAKDAMKAFDKKVYVSCSSGKPFTYVTNDEFGNGVLQLNAAIYKQHNSKDEKTACCYSNITRSEDPNFADAKIVKSPCTPFDGPVPLSDTEEFIYTKCIIQSNKRKSFKKVFEDGHTNVQPSEVVKKRLDKFRGNFTKKTWNVLMVGIDTLSRINLARAMPHTHNFLKQNNWLDFQGYNKMDDNTYPNLMAFLTGRNQSSARKRCDGSGMNSPDNCDFMWKQYENVGYVSAYGEDYVGIDTFGKPLHKGFVQPPTDHYLRPLFMALEKNTKKSNGDKVYCSGQTTSGEQLFNYALNFVKKYESSPFFGFFWTNTFSHDDVSSPSSMDNRVTDFFESLKKSGALNTTIVMFISDHGLRFGKIRSLLTGYYEERLPSLFIWLPTPFRETYPEAFHGMHTNTKRLTTPYDVFMTLQDILYLSGRRIKLEPSEGCPNCQSLFRPVPWNRSCEEAALSPHWCSCNLLEELPLDHKVANSAVKFVLDIEIEKTLSVVNTATCRICAKLNLNKIIHLYLYKHSQKDDSFDDYLSVFSTTPGAMVFEATVRHHKNATFEIQGIVSRLTAYKGKGGCVKTAHLKKYCFCVEKCHKKHNK